MRHAVRLIGLVLTITAGLAAAQDAPVNPLTGRRFLSLEKLTGGETAKGEIKKIHWSITFKDKTYSWLYTDVISVGEYTIDPKTGVLTVGNGKLPASYDAKSGILTWANRKYKAEKEGK